MIFCISGLKEGKFQFVFASPESALKPYWKNVYVSTIWQSRLILIAVDEAHCITEWGDDFRKEYQQLSELRSFFSVPILALTATTTVKVKDEIIKHLQLCEEETDVIYKSPDRPNIYLDIIKKESSEYEVCLKWLIDHIMENGVNSKKIVIYCRSIDTVSEIFLSVKSCLGLDAYANKQQDVSNLLVEMFHKSTHADSKNRILLEFKKQSSNIRCLIATAALGMGIDIRDIDLIVHIGCPKSVLSYWQEAGRCARDGRLGFSLIFYDNFTLAMKNTSKEMGDIIRNLNSRCIREQILEVMTVGDKIVAKSKPCAGCSVDQCGCAACKCCSVCSSKCPCASKSNFGLHEFLSRV